jgi:large subunit ribosomal protein L21
MFAIFEAGAKQYKVSVNDTIYTEKQVGDVGQQVVFSKVLMIDNNVGQPYINNASVVCEIKKQVKADKLLIIKHIPQKHHTKRQGHRQQYTQLMVKEIKQ